VPVRHNFSLDPVYASHIPYFHAVLRTGGDRQQGPRPLAPSKISSQKANSLDPPGSRLWSCFSTTPNLPRNIFPLISCARWTGYYLLTQVSLYPYVSRSGPQYWLAPKGSNIWHSRPLSIQYQCTQTCAVAIQAWWQWYYEDPRIQ
jgi:hypothetical protein